MTRPRNDSHSTEFGLWLRGRLPDQRTNVQSINAIRKYVEVPMFPLVDHCTHEEIESEGYDAENLDYAWLCYGTGKIMLLEEKRCFGDPSRYGRQTPQQKMTHSVLDTALRFSCRHGAMFTYTFRQIRGQDPPGSLKYYGYHLIRFENTCPEDGWTEVDGVRVTIDQLLQFLCFEWFPVDPEECTPFRRDLTIYS